MTIQLSTLPDGVAFEFYREFLEWYCRYAHPRYLEIGCHKAGLICRLSPHIEHGVGVDTVRYAEWDQYLDGVNNIALYHGSSDDFFRQLDPNDRYDLIFIDADHNADQVRRDIWNTLDILSDEGMIVMHDTVPPDMEHTTPDKCSDAFVVVQELRKGIWGRQLQVYTFPVRFGLTVVSKRPVLGTQWL